VALVRALAPRPAIVLMDEPFSGLDNRLRDGVREAAFDLLREEGTSVLLVTHELIAKLPVSFPISMCCMAR